MDGLNSFSSPQLPDSLIKLHFSICPLCDGQDFLKSCEFLRPFLTVLFRATHEQWCCCSQINKKKHYSCFATEPVEIWRMCDWWFFLSVCCSVSNWSVLVLRKRAGREGADLIPLCPVVYPSVPGPLYPRNTWAPVPPLVYPPGVPLSTTCGQVKYPLWRWAPISTVAPKLLPIAHIFCHFIHQHSIKKHNSLL